MGADRTHWLDMATGTDVAALGKAGSSRFRSMSRSSSESRSRWPISDKPVKEFVRGTRWHVSLATHTPVLVRRCEQALELVLDRRLSETSRW